MVSYEGFKPYYKWITFNIYFQKTIPILVYSFKPYYKWITFNIEEEIDRLEHYKGFKPYYKWITFNITALDTVDELIKRVLNLIINGLLSISFI